MLTRAQVGWLVVGVAIGVLATLVLVSVTRPARPPEPRPTPRASFDSSNVDSVNVVPLDEVRTYAANLAFDSVLGAADERPVDFERGLIGVGHRARIEPEVGSHRIAYDSLARGRIIARLRSEAPYEPWGLGSWWTYLWVDRKGGSWRWLFIADTASRTSRPELRFKAGQPEEHPGHHWRQAIARWVTGSTVRPWGTCGDWCCQ